MRKGIWAVVALLAALLAVLLWQALQTPGSPTAPAPSPATEPPPETPDTAQPQRKPTRRKPREAPADAPDATADKPQTPAPPGDAPEGVLEIVREGTGEPIPGARVAFLEIDPQSPEQRGEEGEDPGLEQSYEFVARYGATFVADEFGRVTLPRFERFARVVGSLDDLVGGKMLFPGTRGPWKLELRPGIGLRVRVVDADGNPAVRVPVVLLTEARWAHDVVVTVVFTAGDDAIALFTTTHHVPDRQAGYSVAPGIPLLERPKVSVDLFDVPDEPVLLTLPETGSVTVEFLDERGASFTGAVDVTLVSDVQMPHRRMPPDAFNERRGVRDGQTVFPYVGTGLQFLVTATPRDPTLLAAVQHVAGPTVARDEVLVRIQLGRRRPVLYGVLVNVEDRPMPGEELWAQLLGAVQTELFVDEYDATATTDDEGRFTFALRTDPAEEGAHSVRVVRKVSGSGGRYRRIEIAVIDLPTRLAPAGTDLGRIVVTGSEFLVSGQVLDPEGVPVEGAKVSVQRQRRKGQWSEQYDVLPTLTDSDGRFEFRSDKALDKLRVAVTKDELFLGDTVAFEPGDVGVSVRLSRAGRLRGRVELPEGVEHHELDVFLYGDPARVNAPGWRYDESESRVRISLEEDGSFDLPSLRPGTARIVIFLEDWDEPLATLDDLVIRAGETLQDARLERLDFEDLLSHTVITVLDMERRKLAGARVHSKPVGSDEYWVHETTGPDGQHVLVSPKGAHEVLVTARGYRSEHLANVRDDRTIFLPKMPETTVTLRLHEDIEVPSSPWILQADLHWFGRPEDTEAESGGWSDPRDASDDSVSFGAGRVAVFPIWDPGRYAIRLTLWKTEVSSASGLSLATVPADLEVVITGDGRRQKVIVKPDPEALRTAMEEP